MWNSVRVFPVCSLSVSHVSIRWVVAPYLILDRLVPGTLIEPELACGYLEMMKIIDFHCD
jgi:hypothetical protein